MKPETLPALNTDFRSAVERLRAAGRLKRLNREADPDLEIAALMKRMDGAEALMIIGHERVDLMLLDVDLPFIDGHKVLEALREKGIDVPTIFVSGLPGEEPEVRAFEIGAADFIRKPVKNSVLLARVAKVLK